MEENGQQRDTNDKIRGKKNKKYDDATFKLGVVKYTEQNSGEAAARAFNVDSRSLCLYVQICLSYALQYFCTKEYVGQ